MQLTLNDFAFNPLFLHKKIYIKHKIYVIDSKYNYVYCDALIKLNEFQTEIQILKCYRFDYFNSHFFLKRIIFCSKKKKNLRRF